MAVAVTVATRVLGYTRIDAQYTQNTCTPIFLRFFSDIADILMRLFGKFPYMPVMPFFVPSGLTHALRLMVLAGAFVMTVPAHADDYATVSQLVRAGKHSDALTKAELYLSTKPRDPQMLFLKGVIQSESGKIPEAIQTFTRLTQDYPELPEPYNNLAVLYAGQNQFDKARAALEMAIRTNPSYATAHENLGDIYARLASQAYGKALQLDGNHQAAQPKLELIRDMFAAGKVRTAPTNPPPVTTTAPVTLPVSPTTAPAVASAASAAPTVATSTASAASAASSAATSSKAHAVTSTPVSSPQITAATTIEPSTETKGLESKKQVHAAVHAWAKAWAAKDMTTYLHTYSKSFTPPGRLSRKDWEKQRRERIVGKSNISVKIEGLDIKVTDNKAEAHFRQDYKADMLSVSSRKTLHWVKTGERWLIVKESTGE